MSKVKETCVCGSYVEFDDENLTPVDSDTRLREFRSSHSVCLVELNPTNK